MSTASLVRALRRLEQADELGYNLEGYHGSMSPDITEFRRSDLGVHLGTPDQASDRVGAGWSHLSDPMNEAPTAKGQTIYPLRARVQNPLEMRDVEEWRDPLAVLAGLPEEIRKKVNFDPQDQARVYGGDFDFGDYKTSGPMPDYLERMHEELRRAIKDSGYDSVRYLNAHEGAEPVGVHVFFNDADPTDLGLWPDMPGYNERYLEEFGELPPKTRPPDYENYSYIILDPENIRFRFAPANEGKADISGAADPDLLSAMNVGTYLGSNLPEGKVTNQEPSAKDYLAMLLRGTVQGTAADALSGLYGLAHGGDVQKIQEAQDVLGYKPEGAEAQAASNLGELLAPIMEPISNAVDWVGDRSPIAGAVLQSAPVVAGLPAALRAGRTVNRAANKVLAEELRRPSGAKSAQRGHFRYFDYTNEPSESRAAARSALKELDDNGVPAAEVWKQYGWGREPVTNRPITEVSDSRLDVPSNKLYRGPDGGTLLFGARKGDTGDHLLKDSILQGQEYLKYLDPNYKIRGNPQKNLGSATHYAPFSTESGLIEMGPQASYADFMDVLVHELNHGMQSRFGAPRGGSPEQFGYKDFEKKYLDADEEYRNYIESLKEKLPPGDAQEVDLIMSEKNLTPQHLGRRDSEIIHRAGRLPPNPEIQRALIESLRAMEQKKLFKSEMRGARKKYDNLHGEAMSRLAQNRRNLDPQLIRALYPFEPKYFQQQTGTDIGDLDVRF